MDARPYGASGAQKDRSADRSFFLCAQSPSPEGPEALLPEKSAEDFFDKLKSPAGNPPGILCRPINLSGTYSP